MAASLEITSRVLVPADPERVWHVAMDWSRQREWMWGTQVRGGTGAGAEVVARTGWSGRLVWPADLTGWSDLLV
jgi:hypothetical protein